MFLDESGFLLIPNVTRTWGLRGKTPVFRYMYRQDRISTVSALAVSPKRKRMALYLRFRSRNLNGLDIQDFLKYLLRHLHGPVVLLWDRGPIHRRKEVKAFLSQRRRLHLEFFPAYAPELNPAEFVWSQADKALANTAPEDLDELKGLLRGSVRRIRNSQKLLWSCIYASDLPWTR